MLKGFKDFILRGNVVDLAVGVVIGASFGSIVEALVKDFLTPLIGAVAKVPNFSGWVFKVNGSTFMPGHFINALISFILVAAAVYFFVVVPINTLMAKTKRGKMDGEEANTKKCPECLSDIPKDAKRCAFCAVQLHG